MNNIVVQHREHDVSEIERMAHAFAASKLFGVNNIEQAVALCFIAQAEGRHPASAAQDYHIIQGKPSKKADAMLRDFINAGGKVEWHKLDDTLADATFSHPSGGAVRISWDMARAKKAELKTAMWNKYPRQMLRARVVSEGVRTVFPMATSGMYVPEEVQEFDAPKELPSPAQDSVEAEVVTTIDGQVIEPQPKRLSRGNYTELSAELSACTSLDDLSILWSSKPFKEAVASLPSDWKEHLVAEKDARKEALTPQAAEAEFVPPDFDNLPS